MFQSTKDRLQRGQIRTGRWARFLLPVLLLAVLLTAAPQPVRAKVKLPKAVVLTCYKKTMNIGDEYRLIAIPTRLVQPTFKSSDSKVASVNTYGLITAKKAGTCKITAKITGAEASCKVTVRKTTVTLSRTRVTLMRTQSIRLTADVSNKHPVTWKSSRKKVATVDENGTITAVGHGTCTITAKADDTERTCTVTVKSPTITLSPREVTLKTGQTKQLSVRVSSGVTPTYKSSNNGVASVTSGGLIKAHKKGKATIYVSEDGTQESCTVTVTE